jgi:hypothetical protein
MCRRIYWGGGCRLNCIGLRLIFLTWAWTAGVLGVLAEDQVADGYYRPAGQDYLYALFNFTSASFTAIIALQSSSLYSRILCIIF